MVAEWWKGHGAPGVAFGLLPSTGLIVEHEGQAILAGWLYQDKSVSFGFLSWITSRPGTKLRLVNEAVQVIAGAAEALIRDKNGAALTVVSNSRGLRASLRRAGFASFQDGASQLFKEVMP